MKAVGYIGSGKEHELTFCPSSDFLARDGRRVREYWSHHYRFVYLVNVVFLAILLGSHHQVCLCLIMFSVSGNLILFVILQYNYSHYYFCIRCAVR